MILLSCIIMINLMVYSGNVDGHIQSDIPLGNIFCIQADDLFKVCDVASAADLPHSGDSRLDGDSGTVVQLILFQFVGEDGTGS